MNESLLIGASVGYTVGMIYDVYYLKLNHKRFCIRSALFILLVILSFFIPSKAHAWCDKCKPITSYYYPSVSKLYQSYGEDAEKLILEIQELTDQYAMNGSDVFMTSIGAAMTSLPSGGDPRSIFVSVLLANTAVYFCKTVECHWKTVALMDRLEYYLFSFKKLGDELLHMRFLCQDCFYIYIDLNFRGRRKFYINEYPPCCFEFDGCEIDPEELYE